MKNSPIRLNFNSKSAIEKGRKTLRSKSFYVLHFQKMCVVCFTIASFYGKLFKLYFVQAFHLFSYIIS